LAAGSEEDLKTLIRHVKKASEAAGLQFNIKKTKVMSSTNLNTFTVDEEDIEVVHSYIFLGSNMDREAGCWEDVRRRVWRMW